MPDIALCASTDCPLRRNCYRHAASGTVPTPERQSYTDWTWTLICEPQDYDWIRCHGFRFIHDNNIAIIRDKRAHATRKEPIMPDEEQQFRANIARKMIAAMEHVTGNQSPKAYVNECLAVALTEFAKLVPLPPFTGTPAPDPAARHNQPAPTR